ITVADPDRLDDDSTNDGGSDTQAIFVSVNDWFNEQWGGGFIATYSFTLDMDDVTDGIPTIWRIDTGYSGPGNIVNAWMSGYGGGVHSGLISPTGEFAISNELVDFKPVLVAGDLLTFSVQVNGSPYSSADFKPVYTKLDSGVDDVDGSFGVSPDIEFTNLNSWYNPAWGGGYNVILAFTLTETELVDPADYGWTATVSYIGAGEISGGWVEGYSGGVSTTVISQSSVQYSNETVDFKPELVIGDQIRLAVQVQNAPFDSSDFTLSFSQ
ncbi:MAG: hypothetical protein KAG66_22430, partial [Methylococcales bacterium]|nr:hypothetical protein [Methylococcales bacterium]